MDFSDLIHSLFNKYPLRVIQKGEIVLPVGEMNTSLHFLESGYIRSSLVSEDGLSFTLNILTPGSIFPLTQVLAGMKSNPYEFHALSKAIIRTAPTEKVLKYFDQKPQIYSFFTRRFASGIEGLVNRMEHLIKAGGAVRIISAFDMLIKKFGVKNNDSTIKISLPLTHQDIADIAGVSRETVTRELKKLKKAGIIDNFKKITLIKNQKKLSALLKEVDIPLTQFGL